jgi:hypothetical protein
MPHTPRRSTSPAGLAPVPVALLLPPPANQARLHDPGALGRISAHTACQLIAHYTEGGDLVIDMDANPAVTTAAAWLERRSRVVTDRQLAVLDNGQAARAPVSGAVVLGFATLPRPGATGLAAITDWMRRVRVGLLAPVGFLLVVVSAGRTGRPVEDVTTVIAAARAARLSWHQHILDVHTRLPEHEPRAEPDSAALITPRLVSGRHLPVHNDLYAFTPTGGRDA